VLELIFQSFDNMEASLREPKSLMFNSPSWLRLLKDSSYALSVGAGRLLPPSRHQSRSAHEISSGRCPAQMLRCLVGGDEVFKHVDQLTRDNGAVDFQGQALSGQLVDDVGELEASVFGRLSN
jgi:hypothetical protein